MWVVWRVPGREGVEQAEGCGVRGALVQEGKGVGRPVVGVWGGVRGAEGGVRACSERRVRWVRRRRGRGFRLTLLSAEEKASGEVCEGERRWAGFYAGPQGAGQPLCVTAFFSKQFFHATAWRGMGWGVFFWLQRSFFMSFSCGCIPLTLAAAFKGE